MYIINKPPEKKDLKLADKILVCILILSLTIYTAMSVYMAVRIEGLKKASEKLVERSAGLTTSK